MRSLMCKANVGVTRLLERDKLHVYFCVDWSKCGVVSEWVLVMTMLNTDRRGTLHDLQTLCHCFVAAHATLHAPHRAQLKTGLQCSTNAHNPSCSVDKASKVYSMSLPYGKSSISSAAWQSGSTLGLWQLQEDQRKQPTADPRSKEVAA